MKIGRYKKIFNKNCSIEYIFVLRSPLKVDFSSCQLTAHLFSNSFKKKKNTFVINFNNRADNTSVINYIVRQKKKNEPKLEDSSKKNFVKIILTNRNVPQKT